jgi:hypothetical protein
VAAQEMKTPSFERLLKVRLAREEERLKQARETWEAERSSLVEELKAARNPKSGS